MLDDHNGTVTGGSDGVNTRVAAPPKSAKEQPVRLLMEQERRQQVREGAGIQN
jgi:hypothetical protein